MLADVDNIDLFLLLEASKADKHMTIAGRLVNCHSDACARDLRKRIEDAVYSRDLATTRSDERTYYNGILKVLRRRLREVEKELKSRQERLTEGTTAAKRQSRSRARRQSIRLLQRAGIL